MLSADSSGVQRAPHDPNTPESKDPGPSKAKSPKQKSKGKLPKEKGGGGDDGVDGMAFGFGLGARDSSKES
jgi:hypothetical protein